MVAKQSINTKLQYGIILFILNGALWAFGGIDRPRSGNRAGSEIRSRDFPWVPSPTNDPAAATAAAFGTSEHFHLFQTAACLLGHFRTVENENAGLHLHLDEF